MDTYDIILDQFIAEAGLEGEICMLNHNDSDPRQATDYLCHQLGYKLPDDTFEADGELRIPVCDECSEALISNDWILFYCVGCNESQWLQKKYAKREYPEGTNLIALKQCPKCYNELLD